MDQHPNYSMWMKNKYVANSYYQAPMMSMFNNSWHDQAFADDVAFIWPPRSYTCSFCKRNFRSAQALGGHMNVHRRDRARLKLSPDSQNEDMILPNINPNPNPNPSPNPDPNFLSLSQSPRIVSNSETIASRENMRLIGQDGGVGGVGGVGDEASLSIGLNLKISQNRSCAFEYNEGFNNSKRLKTNDLKMPFLLEPFSKEKVDQGLDLELRLGDSPKFK